MNAKEARSRVDSLRGSTLEDYIKEIDDDIKWYSSKGLTELGFYPDIDCWPMPSRVLRRQILWHYRALGFKIRWVWFLCPKNCLHFIIRW